MEICFPGETASPHSDPNKLTRVYRNPDFSCGVSALALGPGNLPRSACALSAVDATEKASRGIF